jgi:hypothetical protein
VLHLEKGVLLERMKSGAGVGATEPAGMGATR